MYRIRPNSVQRGELAPGRAGVRQTLCMMRGLALRGASTPVVRSTAIAAIREAGVPPADYVAEAAALHRWVANRIRYTRDVAGVETLQAPWYTLAEGAGDCDDKATLLAAMLRSVGNPAKLCFRAIGTDPGDRERFRHVYVVAELEGRRVPLDPTREGTLAGWEYPRATVALEVPL